MTPNDIPRNKNKSIYFNQSSSNKQKNHDFRKKNKNKGIHLLHKSKKVQYYAKNGHHIIESAAVFQVL